MLENIKQETCIQYITYSPLIVNSSMSEPFLPFLPFSNLLPYLQPLKKTNAQHAMKFQELQSIDVSLIMKQSAGRKGRKESIIFTHERL